MAQIKNLATGVTFTVSETPRFINGIWECGDQRFTDQLKTQYQVIVADFSPLAPVAFYLAFTPAERIAIKASTDAMVKEFWATYLMAANETPPHPIDPNLVSVQSALAYLAAPVAPGPGAGILASTARIDQIRAGIAQ